MIAQEHGSAQKVIQSFLDNQDIFEQLSISVANDGVYKEKEVKGVKYFSVPEQKIKNKIANKILGLKLFTYAKMIDIIEKERPDILHFHNRQSLVDLVVKQLSYRPKIICHYHLNFKQPSVPNSANLLLGVSKSVEEHIIKTARTDKKSSFVLNPLSFDLYSTQNIEKKRDNEIKLVFGAGDDEKKGYKEIIQALYKLKDRGIKYKLYLCGNKRDVEIDNTLNIQKMGFLSSKEFYKIIQQSDILLFPSHNEPFGLTLLEAMYLKTKVLPAYSGGIPEILGEEYPYYCKVKDSDSIVENIIALSNLSEEEESRLYKLYENIVSKFHPKTISTELEKKYQEVLDIEQN